MTPATDQVSRPLAAGTQWRWRFRPTALFDGLLRLIVVVACGAALYFAADISEEDNKDIANYRADYYGFEHGYEAGYNFATAVARENLRLPFERFWSTTIVFQIAVLLLAYNFEKWRGLVLSVPVLFSIAASVLGLQVRYGAACALLLLALVLQVRKQTWLALVCAAIACSLHNASYLLVMIGGVALFQASPRCGAGSRWQWSYILYVGALLVLAVSIERLLADSRYISYFGTEFFETKSSISVIYSLAMLVPLIVALDRRLAGRRSELLVHVALLLGVVVLSNYAIISGRLLVMSFFLEPFSICRVMEIRRSRLALVLALALLALSWTRSLYFLLG